MYVGIVYLTDRIIQRLESGTQKRALDFY